MGKVKHALGLFSSETETLFKVEENMKSSKYQSILAQTFEASVGKLKMNRNVIFQHDNGTKHTSKSAKQLAEPELNLN